MASRRTGWHPGTLVRVERALTAVEAAALTAVLAADFPGAAELRRQAATARVVGRCGCGCATIDLAVDDGTPRAEVLDRVPVEAAVPAGGLLLFVDEGRLSCLEYWSTSGEPPAEFPPPALIRPEPTGDVEA